MANAGEDASFDARAVAARNDGFFGRRDAGRTFSGRAFRIGIRSRSRANRKACRAADAFADFEKLSLQLVEIRTNFATMAKAALHEKYRRASRLCEGRGVDVAEVGARIENMMS